MTVLQLLMGTPENKHGNNLTCFKTAFSCCTGNYCLFSKNYEDTGTPELIDGSEKAKVRTTQAPRDEGRGQLLVDCPKSSQHTKAPVITHS